MTNVISARKQLCEAGKYMMDHGLAWGNAGNISARIDDQRYVISASGTYMGELSEEDLVECLIGGGQVDPDAKKPSKELPMHRAIYEERPDIGAVLHASPFYSTMIACSKVDPPSNLFVETMYYLERVERVPYHHPGSEALGQAVRAKAGKANVLLLENHGVVVYDKTVKEARMALQTLEMACRMLIAAEGAGIALNPLAEHTINHFLNHSGYKPKRVWKR